MLAPHHGKDAELGIGRHASAEDFLGVDKFFRRADIMWTGAEVKAYDQLKKRTAELQKNIPGYVKEIIEAHLKNAP